jgi:hypothetical protein
MIGRITTSLAMMTVLLVATIRLPASPCVVTNTASDKPCRMGCCANKTCCATSHKRTGAPNQPAAKSSVDQQIATMVATACVVAVPNRFAGDANFVPLVGRTNHAPPILALICIRLI